MTLHPRQIPETALRFGLPALGTLALWGLGPARLTVGQVALAYVLLLVPLWFYREWRQDTGIWLPLVGIVLGLYWVYYAFPLFTQDPRRITHLGFLPGLPNTAITAGVGIGALASVSLAWGARTRMGTTIVPEMVPEIRDHAWTWIYVRGLLVAGAILPYFQGAPWVFGLTFRQPVTLFVNFIPIVAFALLFRKVLREESGTLDKVLLVGYLIVSMAAGLASGWIGKVVWIGFVGGIVYFAERRRIPVAAFTALVGAFLFLTTGKEAFRAKYWGESSSAGVLEKISFWMDTSLDVWRNALTDSSGQALVHLLLDPFRRLSVLYQTSHVYDMTGEYVSHLGTAFYSLLPFSLVPRFLWWGKPSINGPNRLYQTTYGVTEPWKITETQIGLGIPGEAYAAFGWIGVLAIPFLVGILLDAVQHLCLSHPASKFLPAFGAAMVPQFAPIESQLVVYVADVLQHLLFAVFVFLPVLVLVRRDEPPGAVEEGDPG